MFLIGLRNIFDGFGTGMERGEGSGEDCAPRHSPKQQGAAAVTPVPLWASLSLRVRITGSNAALVLNRKPLILRDPQPWGALYP